MLTAARNPKHPLTNPRAGTWFPTQSIVLRKDV